MQLKKLRILENDKKIAKYKYTFKKISCVETLCVDFYSWKNRKKERKKLEKLVIKIQIMKVSL